MMRKTLVWLVVIIGLFFTACSSETTETGTLAGRVTIGPISPVQRAGEEEVVPPEAYAARKIMVYDKNGSKLVKQVDLGRDGYYSVKLKPGIYTVDINHGGIDRSRDVPKKIEIRSGETVELDIAIDTGIR
ncbi:MAG: hypothetical protein HY663_06135 [Chloroflexi bacterium]|nr:hypothetical protein [Chloroflexota bacterium]